MIKKLATMAAAVGMAEGGDHRSALELMAELDGERKSGRSRILTVTKDRPLAPDAVAYALGLAGRMRADALFMDILSQRASAREIARRDREFKDMIRKVADERRPGFSPAMRSRHAVISGDFFSLLHEACRRIAGVSLVILQKRCAEPCAVNIHVPVFCFETDRPSTSMRS